MKKKSMIIIAVALVMLLTLAGCGGDKADPGAPSAPKNFSVTAGDGQAVLIWSAPSDKGESDIIKYEVSKDNGNTWTNANLDLSYTFTGLDNGTKYTFKVRAVNSSGNGASASKTATPAAGSTGGNILEYNWEYVLSHLPAEFSIKYSVAYSDGDAEIFKVTRTSRGYYFEGEDGPEDSLLYIKNGDKYDQYYYDGYEEIFVLNAGYPQTSQDSINSVLFYYCGMYMIPWASAAGMTKSGGQSIAGRSCDKYTYSISAYGQSVTYTYFIDKEIGACLKMSYTTTVAGASDGFQFECTEFKTTGLTLPAYR